MAKKTLLIEIGDKITKVSVGTRRGKTFHAARNFHFQTPENCILDGAVTTADTLALAIREQLIAHRITDAKDVIYVLVSSKIVSREVMLPPVRPNRIADIVRANAGDYFPIDVSSYQISHSLLETIGGENPGCRVLVTAAPKNIMASFKKLNDVLGLNLIAFDHVANAQFQAFKNLSSGGVTMYLDVGTNYTIATFIVNGVLMLQRVTPLGGDSILNAAMNNASMALERFSEVIELSAEMQWMREHLPTEQYTEVSSGLLTLVARSVDFFKSAYKGENIDRIVMHGSCSKIVGLKPAISNQLGVEVVTLDEVAGLNKILDGENVAIFASVMSGEFDPLDLIPSEMLQTKHSASKSSSSSLALPILLLVVSLGAGGIMTGLTLMDYMAVNNELTTTKNRIEELQPVVVVYNEYSEIIALENNLKLIESDAKNNNANLRAFLEELELKMPSNLLLLSANCDNGGVAMNIEVANMDDAAVVLSQLRTFTSIANLMVSPIVEEENEVGVQVVTFTVSCIYNPVDPMLTEVPTPLTASTTTPTA